ncbi:hypothetical protein EVAR_25603_1 [Eumeta japonica]|uniref:Tc1-like transposase DDE domain-containing protein n=1 Tax=Eumeta variegata TaxID=151549 RepID=A0A4C1V0Q3_EUMVA|nr:hypothetical protein EVAR_25603_1 [Eumeta japonica]
MLVLVYRDEPQSIKVAYERSASKRIIASFFNKTVNVAAVALENCCTVNSDLYTIICLLETIDELRKNNRKRRIILHHDNASSHTAKQTNKCVNEKNVELMSNPSYSSCTPSHVTSRHVTSPSPLSVSQAGGAQRSPSRRASRPALPPAMLQESDIHP